MTSELKTEHPYIVRNADVCRGRPVITGTRLSVEFVIGQLAAGDAPADIVASYPNLTLAAVHDAISYYYDHQSEIDESIAQSDPERLAAREHFDIAENGRIDFRDK